MKFFYNKEYYQNVYKNWTLKKAMLIFLLVSFLSALLFIVHLNNKIGKFADVGFLDSFISALPQSWEVEQNVGLSVRETKDSEPIATYKHILFKIDMTKDFFSLIDFTDTHLIISKRNLAVNLGYNRKEQKEEFIQYFPIDNLRSKQLPLNLNKIGFEIEKNGILVFQNGQFARKILVSDISQMLKKFIFSVYAVILIVYGLMLFLYFMLTNYFISAIMTKILNKKGSNLIVKKTFISLAPIAYICLIFLFLATFVFKISVFMPINLIMIIYGIYIPAKFLVKTDEVK